MPRPRSAQMRLIPARIGLSRRRRVTYVGWSCRGGRRRRASTAILTIMPLKVGTKAPDFTLKTKGSDGLKDVKLSDNFGKKQTVLLFFPLAYTSVCTQELCDTTAGLDQYAGLGAGRRAGGG